MLHHANLTLVPHGDCSIVLTRRFAAPRRLVFDALTVPAMVKEWMGPPGWRLTTCEIDLRVGGRYRFVMHGTPGPGIDCPPEMGWGGSYLEIGSPERLVHTELFDTDWTGGESVITTVLTEQDGHTDFHATIRYASESARDSVLASNMEQGVALSYARLDALLESMQAS